jgi:DNA-binding transcriptional LysR family regulator
METRYFKTLVAVVGTGNFSRAAEVLNITQSAVSQRIKFLEEYYGHQLVDRSGPVIEPTEAGQLVLEKSKGILEKERELEEELKRFGGKKRLSFCCTPTYGITYLPCVLNRFLMQNTDLADLKFIFHQPFRALKGLQENEFDLLVVEHCDGLDLSSFTAETLPHDELIFISAPSLGIPEGLVTLECLLTRRFYARKDGCSSKQLLQFNLAALGRGIDDFQGVVISDDLRLTLDAVIAGGGISFVSRGLAEAPLAQKKVLAHHVRGFDHFRQRSLVLAKGRRTDPTLQNFIGCIHATFAAPAVCL